MQFRTQTCALVAACDFNETCFMCRYEAGAYDYVVAIDAGFTHLEALQCKPDFALGDFDSLGYVPKNVEVEVHPSHKDKSDLELALDYARVQGFAHLDVYGAMGGRIDHTLAALQTCARFSERGMSITLVGTDCAVHVLTGPGEYALPKLEKGTVSTFAANDACLGVSEWGMEYPLEDAVLTNRTSLGLSNELRGLDAGVSVRKGTLYVFHPLA